MGGLESNKRYQIARMWRGSMSMNVTLVLFTLSSSYIQSTKQFIHFLFFSQKAIMVLIMLELHRPFWVLTCFTHAALSLNNCLWISFAHLPSHLMLFFPVLFLLLQVHVWMLFFMVSFCCSKFAFLLFKVQNSSKTFPCCFWFF